MAQCEKYDTPPDIKLNEVMVRFVPKADVMNFIMN
jgi:hypothetical protein